VEKAIGVARSTTSIYFDPTVADLPTAEEKDAITKLAESTHSYAADAEANDTYVITLAPVPSAYAAGMVVRFKANTANTGAATLNVNSLGAKTIKKYHDQDLADNDIESGSVVTVVYDGTNFQLQTPVANEPITTNTKASGVTNRDTDTVSGDQTIAHGLGATPTKVKITALLSGNAEICQSVGVYDGTNVTCIATAHDGGTGGAGVNSTSHMVIIGRAGGNLEGGSAYEATIAVDATNITLSWVKPASVSGFIIYLLWEAEVIS